MSGGGPLPPKQGSGQQNTFFFSGLLLFQDADTLANRSFFIQMALPKNELICYLCTHIEGIPSSDAPLWILFTMHCFPHFVVEASNGYSPLFYSCYFNSHMSTSSPNSGKIILYSLSNDSRNCPFFFFKLKGMP